MENTRPAAVAGLFYPEEPETLKSMIYALLEHTESSGPVPKAIIAPHAGYIYSGPIAASAYHRVEAANDTIHRVILLGPTHRLPISGLAASSADFFETPLGKVRIDQAGVERALQFPQVKLIDEAHTMEHSLEVHLPFLQSILKDFTIVPLVVGDASADEVSEVLEALWGGDETLIVISSDLSHYHSYNAAKSMDKATSQAIENLTPERIQFEDACGRIPISGLLLAARHKKLKASTIDLRNSGDTSGAKDKVVGYGAYLFEYEH